MNKHLTIYSKIDNPIVHMYNKNIGERYTSNSSLLSDSILYYKENTSNDYINFFRSNQYAISLNIHDDFFFDRLLKDRDSIVEFDGQVIDNEGKVEVDGVVLPRVEANKLAFTINLLTDNTIHGFDTDVILNNRPKYLRANSRNKVLKKTIDIAKKSAKEEYLAYKDMLDECSNKTERGFSTYNVNKFVDREEVVSPYDLTFKEIDEHILPVSTLVRLIESGKLDDRSNRWSDKYLISYDIFHVNFGYRYNSNYRKLLSNLMYRKGYAKTMIQNILKSLNMSIVRVKNINVMDGKCYVEEYKLVDTPKKQKMVGEKKSILTDLRALLVDFDNQDAVYVFTFANLISKALGVQVAVENTNPKSSYSSYHVILKLAKTPLVNTINKSGISLDTAVSCIDGVIDYCIEVTNRLLSNKKRYFKAASSLMESGIDAIIDGYNPDSKLVKDDTVSSKLHAGVILGKRVKKSSTIKKFTTRVSRIDAIFNPVRTLNTSSFSFVQDCALEQNSKEVVENKIRNFKIFLKSRVSYNLEKINPVYIKDSAYNVVQSTTGNVEINGVKYAVINKKEIPNRQSYEAVVLDIIIKARLAEVNANAKYNRIVEQYEKEGKKVPNKSKLGIANPDTVYEYTINNGLNSIARLPIDKFDKLLLSNMLLSNSGVKFTSEFFLDNSTTLSFREGSEKSYGRLNEADAYNLIISDIVTGNASYISSSVRQGSIKKVISRLEKIGIIQVKKEKVGKTSYTRLLLNSKIHVAQLLTLLSSKYMLKIIKDKRFAAARSEEDILVSLSEWYKETMLVSKIAKSKDAMTISQVKTMYSFMIFTNSSDDIYDILNMVFDINSKREYLDVDIETFEGEIVSYKKEVEVNLSNEDGESMKKEKISSSNDDIDLKGFIDSNLSKLAESWGIPDDLDSTFTFGDSIVDEEQAAIEKQRMEEAMKPVKIRECIDSYIKYANSSIESHKLAAEAAKDMIECMESESNNVKSPVAILGQRRTVSRHTALLKANMEVMEKLEEIKRSLDHYIENYTYLEFNRMVAKMRSDIICKHTKK